MPQPALQLLLRIDENVGAESIVHPLEVARPDFSITVCHSDAEALRCLQQQAEVYWSLSLVILEVLNLPEQGVPFLRALRQDPILKRAIVFVLTNSKLDSDKAAAYDARVAGYLLRSEVEHNPNKLLSLLDTYHEFVELPPTDLSN